MSHTVLLSLYTLSVMANKDNRQNNKRSICEMSMLLVANIIRMSSLSFSALSFTTNLSPPQDETPHVPSVERGNTTSAPKLSKKSKLLLQHPEGTKKPRSYLMKPEKEGPTLVKQELNCVDDVNVNAENYISRIRGKIWNDANNDTAAAAATKRFSAKPCSSGFIFLTATRITKIET